jgi:penicillin G amidase
MKLRLALLALLLTGCPSEDDDGSVDTGTGDTGTTDVGDKDTGTGDTGTGDTGVDGGEIDTGVPDGGVVADIRIPDLSGDVQIDFDEFGVLHASCSTDLDCFAVEGYFHAAHRFGQMDLRRRFSKGELAEVLPLGPGIDNSIRAVTIFGARDGGRIADQIWANTSTPSRAMFEAYTRGVNAWIDDLRNQRNGARLTDDWSHLGGQVEDWAPQDSIACVLALIESLTNQSAVDIAAGEVFASVPATVAADLYSLHPAGDSFVLPPPGALRNVDTERLNQIAVAQARLQRALPLLRAARAKIPQHLPDLGSNNWVIGPSRTADGKALLANDPHLGMDFPSVWYVAHLDARTNGTGQLHVAGASFAGLPGVILGQNEQIAWGGTTAFFDMADVYVEELDPTGTMVNYNGGLVAIQEQTFRIDVLDGQPIDHVVRYVPHHGPIIAEDLQAGMALSLRWTAQDATTDAEFLLGLNLAGSVEEVRTAMRNVTTIGQNIVSVDRAGNFGWFPYNQIPARPWASLALPSWLPLPGDGSAEWQGAVPYDDLPQAMNTVSGFIATANNDMTGHLRDGDPTNDGQAAYQPFVALGYRHQRISERIEAGGNAHTRDTMSSIQADVRVNIGADTVPAIVANTNPADLSPAGVLAYDALSAWDFECPTGLNATNPNSGKDNDPVIAASSIGCTVFHAVWPRLKTRTFEDDLDRYAADLIPVTDSALVFALTGVLEGNYWDDVATAGAVETEAEILAAVLDDAGDYLSTELGADSDDWRWGRIHTVTLTPPIFPPSSGTFANDGGLHTVDVAHPSDGENFSHRGGPSMRFACDADVADGVRCTMELPGGQRHFADDPHFDDLLARWLVNDPFPLHFVAADVAAASLENLTVRPAN